MMTKEVSFAHAMSPNADKYGFKEGGYVLSIRKSLNSIPKTVGMFKTEEEAYRYAEKYYPGLGYGYWDLREFNKRQIVRPQRC